MARTKQPDDALSADVDTSDIAPPPTTDPSQGEREGNEESTGDENVSTTKEQRSFGGLSASEAGRRSAEARRRKALAQQEEIVSQSSGQVVLVRVPVPIGDIISRLASDAKKGSTHAARELRSYMEAYPAEDATDMSVLDKRTRQQVIARLLADIERDEGALPDGPLDPNL